jgi:Hemerythrin HHE cation binding domain.
MFAARKPGQEAAGEQRDMPELTELGGVLHEEHFRIVVWVSELKNRVMANAAHPWAAPQEDDEQEICALIAALADFSHHHAFEEEALFPQLRHCDTGTTANYLADEHAAIEPIIERVQVIAGESLRGRNDPGLWTWFRRAVDDLYTEVIDHLAREEELIVQRLRDLIDTDMDRRLARQHAQRPLIFSVGVN